MRKNKGITLIALIITIIILIILAGVSINFIFGQEGILNKTKQGAETYKEEQAKEKLRVALLEYKLENLSEEKIELDIFLETKDGITLNEQTNKVNVDGYEFTIDETTLNIKEDKGQGPIESQEPQMGKDNINGTTHTKIGSGDFSFNNPVIPVGFKTVETTLSSWVDENKDGIVDDWNEGLVIEDEDGNQFVWIPVDNTNITYGYHYTKGTTGNLSSEQNLPMGVSSEDTQILTYGGFYIARYEAGIPSSIDKSDKTLREATGIPVSKQNEFPWNCISWNKAKENSEIMYKLENTSNKVQSGLITDRMWETTMQWLEKANLNVKTDSSAWGNYKNAAVSDIKEYSMDYGVNWIDKEYYFTKSTSNQMFLLKTGHTEYTNRKNIYDLAGNVWEYTNAKYDSSNYIIRGGNYSDSSLNYSAAYRGYSSGSVSNYSGFRVCLFLI